MATTTATGKDQEKNSNPLFFWREFETPHGYLSQWFTCHFASAPIDTARCRDPAYWDLPTHLHNASNHASTSSASLAGGSPHATDGHKKEKNGVKYNSTEQYMMHAKALVFGDNATAAKILASDSPEEQRDLGRAVRNYDGGVWNPIRYAVVRRGNYLKFSQARTADGDRHGARESKGAKDGKADDISLRKLLLETGNRQLVEASPTDRLWGIGFSADEAEKHRGEWGQNMLGRAIGEVRELLRKEEEEEDGGRKNGGGEGRAEV